MKTITEKQEAPSSKSAWVVFSHKADLQWLKILKPGFRHCFIMLNDGQRWVSVDPLSHFTDIEIYHHIAADFNLPHWLEGQGFKAVKADINFKNNKPAPWMFFTCVESIKRILGIHKRFIFTPWQLYKFLKKSQSKQSHLLKGESSWAV